MGKPKICIGENKGAVAAKLISTQPCLCRTWSEPFSQAQAVMLKCQNY